MLVTLVILAMVAAILGQALAQLARVEQLLAGGRLRSAAEALRAEWVRGALASLLPGTADAERMRGDARELSGLSTDVPQMPAPGLATLRLRLVTDDRTDTTRLELLPEGDRAAPVQLLSWPGREGHFRYLDAAGLWHERWPLDFATAPPGTSATAAALALLAARALPRAILLDTGAEGPGVLVAVPLASPSPSPTRTQWESL